MSTRRCDSDSRVNVEPTVIKSGRYHGSKYITFQKARWSFKKSLSYFNLLHAEVSYITDIACDWTFFQYYQF